MRIPAPIVPLSAALATLLLVAGCSAPVDDPTGVAADGGVESCTPLAGGAASASVTIDDSDPQAPVLEFETPIAVEATERTIVTAGDGELVENGSTAVLDISMFSAATGESSITTGHGAGQSLQLPIDAAQTLSGFVKAVACAHVGDRIVAVLAPADAYGDAGNTEVGIGAGESVVLLVDVLGLIASRADGELQPAPEGLPPVAFDADGRPTVTISGEAPTELTTGLLRLGDGDVVAEGDYVTMQYQGINWRTGAIFDESWGSGPRGFTTDGVIEGFGSALVGQTVGSTVIVVIPPELGYGPMGGNATAGIDAEDTLVFVIDILATEGA